MEGDTRESCLFYIGVKKAYEDAKVCAALCCGGPVKYALKDRLGKTITMIGYALMLSPI